MTIKEKNKIIYSISINLPLILALSFNLKQYFKLLSYDRFVRLGNIFVYFFIFMLSIGMGVIFLITNRVTQQIIPQTKV